MNELGDARRVRGRFWREERGETHLTRDSVGTSVDTLLGHMAILDVEAERCGRDLEATKCARRLGSRIAEPRNAFEEDHQ